MIRRSTIFIAAVLASVIVGPAIAGHGGSAHGTGNVANFASPTTVSEITAMVARAAASRSLRERRVDGAETSMIIAATTRIITTRVTRITTSGGPRTGLRPFGTIADRSRTFRKSTMSLFAFSDEGIREKSYTTTTIKS